MLTKKKYKKAKKKWIVHINELIMMAITQKSLQHIGMYNEYSIYLDRLKNAKKAFKKWKKKNKPC